MFGKNVNVIYKNREMQVFIPCVPSTPLIELEGMALYKLERLENEHPKLSLEDIQSQINMCVL